MAEVEASAAADEGKPGSSVRGCCASAGTRVLVVLIAGTCALFSSNNWCFVVLLAAFAAFLVDCAVCAIRRWIFLRLPVAAGVGIAVGMLLGVGPAWAFQEAFERDPPSGIRDVRISRHYSGGPGEHVLIIEFTADSAALQALVRGHTVSSDSPGMAAWRDAGGEWEQVADFFIGPNATRFTRSSWRRIRPLERAEAFDLGEVNEGRLVLFHEASTGRCVAMHVRL